MKKSSIYIAISLTLLGCATSPDKIAASYVSPLQYQNYDCDQIIAEMTRVGDKSSQLNGELAKKASGDTAKTTIGLILFFPSLFFLDGDSPQSAEYAKLKGEYEALQKVAIEKKCNIIIKPIAPSPELNEVKATPNPIGGN